MNNYLIYRQIYNPNDHRLCMRWRKDASVDFPRREMLCINIYIVYIVYYKYDNHNTQHSKSKMHHSSNSSSSDKHETVFCC